MKIMKVKKILIEGLRFFLSVLPLAVYLIIFREKYFLSARGWSSFVYIALIVVVVALKDSLADMLRNNTLFKLSLVMLIFAYFFKYVSEDLVWLSIMGAVGGALAIIPDYMARELGKDIDAKRSGEATATAFAEKELKVVKKK